MNNRASQVTKPRRLPAKLDPATIGISFVDILFALAVGQVLDPIKKWAQNPHGTPLPLPVWTQLAVVLVLILTSWVGYHSSSNRPRFRLGFFNLELVKFGLDVAMVVVYFVAAAIAARQQPTLRIEALLVMISFGLYVLWDLIGALQKSGANNRYEREWNRVQQDTSRMDVVEDWTPTRWPRICVTISAFIVATTFFVSTMFIPVLKTPSREAVIAADLVAIIGLLIYRFMKDKVA